jgi:hypothetical protein
MVADFTISSVVSTLKAISTSKHLSLEHIKPSVPVLGENYLNFYNIRRAYRRAGKQSVP